jgi:hypothetical protein
MMAYGNRVNLIICQKSKVNDWFKHFCDHYHHKNWAVYDLTKKNQLMLFLQYLQHQHEFSPNMVGIINYELAWRRPVLKGLQDFTLMLDESSLIQNRKA